MSLILIFSQKRMSLILIFSHTWWRCSYPLVALYHSYWVWTAWCITSLHEITPKDYTAVLLDVCIYLSVDGNCSGAVEEKVVISAIFSIYNLSIHEASTCLTNDDQQLTDEPDSPDGPGGPCSPAGPCAKKKKTLFISKECGHSQCINMK